MDDVWLNQKDDFDDVLASLNSAHASTANSDNEQDQESSKNSQTEKQSLRDISKKSKKRVHYEKFTKGKDLSRMSQKDLANILGTDKAKKRRIEEGLIKEKIEKERQEEEENAKKVKKNFQYTCGEWDILILNLTSITFTNFFRCLIFVLYFFTNADVLTIKDESSKEKS